MSWVIWVTGPPASGKSTLTRLAADRLAAAGRPVTVLELDRLRRVLTPDATYSASEREVVYRALVFMAVELAAAERPVLIDATGHRRQWRQLARACLDRFAEVQVECPVEVCEARDRARGAAGTRAEVYAPARRPGARVPAVNIPYERSLSPELTIDTSVVPPDVGAEQIVQLAQRLADGAAERGDIVGGAVIWLTGLPGSGKTTLAVRLAEALHGDGVPVTILEWVALRASLFGDACPSAAELGIGHRALALTAAYLAEAGLIVIVDGTAARRAWRQIARAMVDRFAEVQLLCPPETCAARERDVRWQPRRLPVSPASIAIDWPSEYEYADCPELTIDTAARSEWMATEDLRALARRLLRGEADGKEAPCVSEIS